MSAYAADGRGEVRARGGGAAPAARYTDSSMSRSVRGRSAQSENIIASPAVEWTRGELAKAGTPEARFCARPVSVHPVKDPGDQVAAYRLLHAYTRKVAGLLGA